MEEEFRALVAGAVAAPVNWVVHPQGQPLPGVVLTVVSASEGMTMQGPDGLSAARVQVDCYAPTYTQAKTTSRAIVAALNGYQGGGFRLVEHVATRDGREGGTNEAERPFRVSLDFMAHWRAT
jgi:hypothetical protein